MYMPSLFSEGDLMDDWMNGFDQLFEPVEERNVWERRNPLFGRRVKNIMKTDVKESDQGYEMEVDLPGFKKNDVRLEMENGYLTIQAKKSLDKDEKDKNGHMIRQERYSGSMARSFYVGEGITESDVHAHFENGVLKISLPKKNAKEIPEHNYIEIEG